MNANFSKKQQIAWGKVFLWNILPILLTAAVVHAYHLFDQTDCQLAIKQKKLWEKQLTEESAEMSAFLTQLGYIQKTFDQHLNSSSSYLEAVKAEDEINTSSLERQLKQMEREIELALSSDRRLFLRMILDDPRTRSLEQAEAFVEEFISMPINSEMADNMGSSG